jgi:hypothetical protein
MRKIMLLTSAFILLVFAITPVFAQGVGTIRLEPHGSYYPDPIMLSSPATFNVSVQSGGDPTCDPHILLVMTADSYNGLTGDVTVNWTNTVDLTVTSWTMETENGNKIPSGVPIHSGAGYTVASLKDHLGTSDAIYWSFNPILDGNPLTQDKQDFTVTLPSSAPRMLVYVLGKTGEYDGQTIVCPSAESEFDNRVPPTQPAFVVPELSTIVLAGSSFGALAIYTLRKKQIKQK